MKTINAKNVKNGHRVTANTVILVILAVLIGAVTGLAAKRLSDYRINVVGVSDAPALCFDGGGIEDGVIMNAYPCVEDDKPVTTDNENVIFLYNRANFAATVELNGMILILITMGSILSFGTLVAAFVYWNHNRNR